MADMYGNYDKRSEGVDRMQMARKMNDLSEKLTFIAKKLNYQGNAQEFGVYSTMYIMNVFGPGAVDKMLMDDDTFKLGLSLVAMLDGTDEMDKEKQEARELKDYLDNTKTSDIVKRLKEMGADQVDIDHVIESLGRDEDE